MKKYWKWTAIIIVIVLSIGTFYVNSARSSEPYPKFIVQTLSGDAREIQPLMLQGYYADTSSMNYVNTNLTISRKGTTYPGHSILDQLTGNPSTEIGQLQEKYRNFMRGKDSRMDLFFEDNRVLAYADVDYRSVSSKNYKFAISVLTKKDGTINSFKLDVSDGRNLDYIYVEDVQIIENNLYLITQNTVSTHNDFYEEKHIYTIDLATQKISNHEAMIQIPNGQDQTHIDVQFVRTSPTKANDHIILLKTENKLIDEPESTIEEFVSQEVISYNIATKEKETITIPGLRLEKNSLSFFDGSIIYFMTLDGQNLVVTPYRLADDTVGKSYRIPLSGEEGNTGEPITTVIDGKLYAASSQMNADVHADVIVADAYTGDILFKGQVALEGSSKETEQFDLFLYEFIES